MSRLFQAQPYLFVATALLAGCLFTNSCAAQSLGGRLGIALNRVDQVLGNAGGGQSFGSVSGISDMAYFPNRTGGQCQTPPQGWSPAPVYPGQPVVPTYQPDFGGSQPVGQVPVPAPGAGNGSKNAVRQQVAEAKRLFQQEKFDAAAKQLDAVIAELPEDANLHQFRAMAYFAQSNYDMAAADVYDALQWGNTWNWAAVSDVYGQLDYTQHLRSLEASVKADGKQMPTRFLLAYHYLVLGHLEHGAQQLKKVLEISPEEPVATRLLQVVQQRLAADQNQQK